MNSIECHHNPIYESESKHSLRMEADRFSF